MTPGTAWKAPTHLEPTTRRWLETRGADYELEAHHFKLLALLGKPLWQPAMILYTA